MTLEEEVGILRIENKDLMARCRRHRQMSEIAEADARDLRRRMAKVMELLKQVLDHPAPPCADCLKAVAFLVLKIGPQTSLPPTEQQE